MRWREGAISVWSSKATEITESLKNQTKEGERTFLLRRLTRNHVRVAKEANGQCEDGIPSSEFKKFDSNKRRIGAGRREEVDETERKWTKRTKSDEESGESVFTLQRCKKH